MQTSERALRASKKPRLSGSVVQAKAGGATRSAKAGWPHGSLVLCVCAGAQVAHVAQVAQRSNKKRVPLDADFGARFEGVKKTPRSVWKYF